MIDRQTILFVIGMVASVAIGACTAEQQAAFLEQLGGIADAIGQPAGMNGEDDGSAADAPAPSNQPGNTGDDNGGNGAPGSPADVPENRLSAVLTGPSPEHGDAEYREEGTRRRLKIELEDAVPGSVHMIVVDGVHISDLTIGPAGEGEVEFDTKVEDEHLPWPAELPDRLSAGAVIQVGDTTGVLGA